MEPTITHSTERPLAPRDPGTAQQGIVVQVSTSPGGMPNRPILEGDLTVEGFVGDGWNNRKYHGGPQQAVLLISLEVLEELTRLGFPVFPGAMGENVTTEGVSFASLRIGQQLKVGEAHIQITKVRQPCNKLDVYGDGIQKMVYNADVKRGNVSNPRWGWSGFYARVLQPGKVRAQDIITVDPLAGEG
jgi:MOSC domain-containing protein YiiM